MFSLVKFNTHSKNEFLFINSHDVVRISAALCVKYEASRDCVSAVFSVSLTPSAHICLCVCVCVLCHLSEVFVCFDQSSWCHGVCIILLVMSHLICVCVHLCVCVCVCIAAPR